MNKPRRGILVVGGIVLALAAGGLSPPGRRLLHGLRRRLLSASVRQRLEEFEPAVRRRIGPSLQAAGIDWPPRRIVLLGLKAEKRLELYAANAPDAPLGFVKSWPILAASGSAGPKLRQGDRQVPEGLYRIESLNPNSRFHLAARINYPNAADRARAAAEGRTDLGGDIMIHGSDASVGCLAMGDPAAEEIFVLIARAGLDNVEVILAPHDFRARPGDPLLPAGAPDWTAELYDQIRAALAELPPVR